MNASPTKRVERVVATKKAGERETNASGQLTAPEAAGRRETKEPCPMKTAESTGAQETNVPEERSAAVRRDGEPLTRAAMEPRQEEAAADRCQAAAGERPPSSVREGIGPMPLAATDPGRKMRDAAGSDRPQLTTARADRIETSVDWIETSETAVAAGRQLLLLADVSRSGQPLLPPLVSCTVTALAATAC